MDPGSRSTWRLMQIQMRIQDPDRHGGCCGSRILIHMEADADTNADPGSGSTWRLMRIQDADPGSGSTLRLMQIRIRMEADADPDPHGG